jgi:hypothetical protein
MPEERAFASATHPNIDCGQRCLISHLTIITASMMMTQPALYCYDGYYKSQTVNILVFIISKASTQEVRFIF